MTLMTIRACPVRTPRSGTTLLQSVLTVHPSLTASPEHRFSNQLGRDRPPDGRDVAASYVDEPWLSADSLLGTHWEPGGYRYGPFPRFWVESDRRAEFVSTSDLHRYIWSWRRHVESARQVGERRDGDDYIELRYEQLARDPEVVSDQIADALSLSSDGTKHLQEASREASPASIGRWEEDFDADDLETIREEAGALLDELGYD